MLEKKSNNSENTGSKEQALSTETQNIHAEISKDVLFVDSGASKLNTVHNEQFKEYSPLVVNLAIHIGDNALVCTKGSGTVAVQKFVGQREPRNLKNILYFP